MFMTENNVESVSSNNLPKDYRILNVAKENSLFSFNKKVELLKILEEVKYKDQLDIPIGSMLLIFSENFIFHYEYCWFAEILKCLTLSEVIGMERFEEKLSVEFRLKILNNITRGLISLNEKELIHCNRCSLSLF